MNDLNTLINALIKRDGITKADAIDLITAAQRQYSQNLANWEKDHSIMCDGKKPDAKKYAAVWFGFGGKYADVIKGGKKS